MKDSFSNYRYFKNKAGFWCIQRRYSFFGFSWWSEIKKFGPFDLENDVVMFIKLKVDRPKFKPEYKTVNEEMFKY